MAVKPEDAIIIPDIKSGRVKKQTIMPSISANIPGNMSNAQMPSIKQLPIPPPMKIVHEAISDSDTALPGDVSIDDHGRVLKSYLVYDGFSATLVEAYDNWITNILPRQIQHRQLHFPNGKVYFRNVYLTQPEKTPMECRESNLTYSAEMLVDAVFRPDAREDVKTEDIQLGRINAGKIPVMLGSILSHLRGRTPTEIEQLRECTKDPGGYFVIKGTERLILIQEKLRQNRILTFMGKGTNKSIKNRLLTSLTHVNFTGSTMVVLIEGVDKRIELNLHFMKKDDKENLNTMGVFLIFRMLGSLIDKEVGITDNTKSYANPENIITLILQFTRDKWRNKVRHALAPSLLSLSEVADDYLFLASKMGIKTQNQSPEQYKQLIIDNLIRELFPQMEGEPLIRRMEMLAIMTVRMAEVFAGVRMADDRDSWGNKRLESAGPMMEHEFTRLWNKLLNVVQKKITEKNYPVESLRSVFSTDANKIIGDEFESSFTGNWGVKGVQGASQKEGSVVTDVLKGDNILSIYSHIRRVNAATSRQAKQPQIRMVQPTQAGYICVPETPEGEACGIVKNLAVTVWLSIERDDTIARQLLTESVNPEGVPYYSPYRDVNHTGKLMINGKFIGWCMAEETRDFARQLRRQRRLDKDTCVVLDYDNFLYIYTDGSRPTRPLLIVDTDGQLIIEKKNLWGADWDTLMTEGAVEYIDAFEQEYIKLAESKWAMEAHYREIQEAQSRVEEATANIAEITAGRPVRISVEDYEGFTGDALLTLEDAKNRLVDAQDVLNRLMSKRSYTHCEIDPQAILGISASVIPFTEHNQGPRNTFACIKIHQKVRQNNGYKDIGQMTDYDQVLTIDPITMKPSYTSIRDYFKIDPTIHGKKVYEIITINGRRIEATGDHPFLTQRGMVHVDKLNLNEDTLCVYHEVSDLDHSDVSGFLDRLSCKLDNDKLPIIARLFGFFDANGDLENSLDIERFNNDLINIGYTLLTEEDIISISRLFLDLSGTPGQEIPDWIVNGSKAVKREFLGGFMGANGFPIKITGPKDNETISLTCQCKTYDNIKSLWQWIQKFRQLYVDLGFEMKEMEYHSMAKNEVGQINVELEIFNDQDNIIKFMDIIGYRYSSSKQRKSLIKVEWLRHCQYQKETHMSLKKWEKTVKMKEDCIFLPINTIKEIQPDLVCDFTTVSDTHTFVAGDGFVVSNCGQGKQALGITRSNHLDRFDTTVKMLSYPSRPIFEPQLNRLIGLGELPTGQMVTVAIMTYGGYNQEDAFIFNKAAIDRGLFRMVKYKTVIATLKPEPDIQETFSRPEIKKKEDMAKYAHLDERGIVMEGSLVKEGDILVSKKREMRGKPTEYIYTRVGIGDEGRVDRVLLTYNASRLPVVKIRIRTVRTPVVGDKFSNRHAQKGTIGVILREEDMPFVATGPNAGLVPSIITNPHSIPSRMTMGMIIEIIASKVGAMRGERINASAFRPFDIDEFTQQLKAYGFESRGNERMINPRYGRMMNAHIFVGPCYYQALRHHVKDKIQKRAQGAINPTTRQPVGGRNVGGGIKFGEMERDSMVSHGATEALRDRMCVSSDEVKAVVCAKCGDVALTNIIAKTTFCRSCVNTDDFGVTKTTQGIRLLIYILKAFGYKITSHMKKIDV